MDNIEKLVACGEHEKAIEVCENIQHKNLAKLLKLSLSDVLLAPENPSIKKIKIKIKILCSWDSPENIRNFYNKLSKGCYTWNNIELVLTDPDYYVIINTPGQDKSYVPEKTIIFQMEPNMSGKWGEWGDPDPKKFMRVCTHAKEYNNLEWHLSKSYTDLLTLKIDKNPALSNDISTVLSSKYQDSGHIKRIDFVKFLEKKNQSVHVFGSNKWGYKNYKGELPVHQKDNGLFPYKYTFNAENNSIKNYFTEKLVDAILSECLCFYSGCYNVREFIDERAFVYLELSNFEKDYEIVKKAIDEDLWSKRLPYILEAKKKILNYLQFFPRVERIINTSTSSLI